MATVASKPSSNGPRYAPEDPTLPKPWRGLVDGSTGYLYYWNPVTNVTQYERPEPEQLPPPPPPPQLPLQLPPHPPKSVSSSVQIHQQLPVGGGSGRREGHEDDGRHLGSRGNQHQSSRGSSSHPAYGSVGHDSSSAHGRGHAVLSSRESGRGRSSGDSIGSLSAEAYRRLHEITVNGDDVPAPHTTFEATGFPSEILREVHHAGFSTPTPIQAQSWPIALNGRDIVAIAKTGSGKTLGYLIPGFIHVKHLRNNPKMGPMVLVLSPTRELATQIQEEAMKFGRSSRISSACLYGGAPKGPQLRDIDRGVDIVVATPGRLNDILEMRRVSLRQVSYLVLDEADRMLDMGFEPQIRKIIKDIPPRRQTLMFTATWPKEVRKIATDLLVNPVQVNIGCIDELVANKAITQYVEVIAPSEKLRRLEHILRSQEPGSKVIVFCSTKRMCDQLARTLTRQFGALAIHGDKSQSERDWVLNQFRTGRSPILVATDVAARGLDIKDIRVVINYDFPTGVEDYVHRIGRTGRAGATGVSYTFFCSQDSKYASDLVKVLEGASQRVPSELRDMVARGGYGGKSIRWSGSSARDGGRLNGGLRSDSSYGGRGGRGRSRSPARDRYSRGHRDGYDTKATAASGDQRVGVGRACSQSRSRSRSRSRGHGGWANGRGHSSSRSPYRGHTAYGNGHGHGHGRSRSRSLKCGRSRSRSHSASRSSKRNNGAGPEHDRSAPLRREPSPLDHHNGGSVYSPQRHHRQSTSPYANGGIQEAQPDPPQSPQHERPLSPYNQTDKQSPSTGQRQWASPYQHSDAEGALANKPNVQPLPLHHNVEDEEEGMISADEEGMIRHEMDAGPNSPVMKDQEP